MAIEAATIAETAHVAHTRVIELTNPKWEEQQALLERARQLDMVTWIGRAQVDKYEGDWTGDQIDRGLAGDPFERVVGTPQLLVYGGASVLWECLLGNGTATAGQALTFFNNTNAKLGVGDSTTTESAAHTDLQATTNKLRKAMDSTYPTHSDGTVVGSASAVFRATFGTSDANWTWNEWGIFNAASSGRMLNRKMENLGTKSSAASWVLTCTLSLG